MASAKLKMLQEKHSSRSMSILNTTDELFAAVPWGNWRSVLVYRRHHAGRTWVRLRTFNKHRTKGCWYPSPRYFVVPLDCAQALAQAITAAARGEKHGLEPDWYSAFEAQYANRQASVASAPGMAWDIVTKPLTY